VNPPEGSHDEVPAPLPSAAPVAASPQPQEQPNDLSGELSDETMDSIVGGLSTPVLPLGLRVDPYGR
jgi:hypothetical protein